AGCRGRPIIFPNMKGQDMINGNRIILRDKSTEDAWDDYAWESDPELAHLDAAPVLPIPYSQFLLDYTYALRSTRPSSHRFSVYTPDGKHIGNCSYYNLNRYRSETELGIMIGNRDYWDKGYGTDVVTTLVNHIFGELKLNRIYLKTLESNIRAQKCFHKCGFNPFGNGNREGFKFMFMELHRHQWQEKNKAESQVDVQ
ncbi:GNAT family N-acetyltransferase, partial [Chloroflexota bacterium]